MFPHELGELFQYFLLPCVCVWVQISKKLFTCRPFCHHNVENLESSLTNPINLNLVLFETDLKIVVLFILSQLDLYILQG